MALQQRQQLYETVVDELRDRLVSQLGDRVEAILVYGSVARGEATQGSDIDLLLIIGSSKKEMVDQAFDVSFEIDLEHGTLTTLSFYAPDEFQDHLARGEPLLQEVMREGKVIYATERFRNYQRTLQTGR